MEKLTLQNPITINGKKVKTLTYDTAAITEVNLSGMISFQTLTT